MPTCLITAANRGIGFELARAALESGWTVYGSVRTQQAVNSTAERLGEGFHPLVFDVTDHAAVRSVASGLDSPLDLLINNAGIITPERQSALDMDFEGFAETLEVNTLAPLAVSQAFLPHLRRSGAGRILTISSQMAWMGYRKSDTLAYRASKAAVNKVMQGLATDLEPEGIPVALIDPGWVRTDMGGPQADNDPADVARGVLKIGRSLSVADTGKFFKWSGEERPF
ncbi:Short-chain dehydrogenase/reductase SDR [Stappia aggregata IAM 12614]|uniref:Short-chain dehydrogenase/reductase SDR n=1 Tax=Roseibium aggregatum (strain ATCC 25650 / DSM 13394 / JCM 20685 / NBRC 16684 / NCIMB 2208 / IAM 12614 / B1) TaxID=384765 RepID=A0NTY7_ROSAI|nr:SDR family oxidoreductase [Roseibium aggregatum]EAV43896.1 Short-chain dehydrogenase/reductase SDR [Stappia aggregata IAM 12614] [Roseibium aggregatum IAM 12614]